MAIGSKPRGREFAGVLERLVRDRPVPLDEVVIIGHSMGGLVNRSACHYVKRERHRWLDARTPVPLPDVVQCFTVAASRSANGARLAGDGLVPCRVAECGH